MSNRDVYELAHSIGGRVATAYDDSPEGRAEIKEKHAALMHAAAAVERDKRRQRRKELDEALGAVERAPKKGVTVTRVINRGVTYEFGQQAAPASGGEVNEWDIDLGTNTPSLRQ